MFGRGSALGVAVTLLGITLWAQSPCLAAPSPAPVPPAGVKTPSPAPAALPVVTIETTKGTITAELYTDRAPITTANFIALVKRHFFNGLTFHRVVPGFVVQGGDPSGTGEGGSGTTIPLEIGPGLSHDAAGVFGMARDSDPDSASSQFYITQAATTRLDGKYAVFGRVLTGLDVVMAIQVGDTMTAITVTP